MRIVTYHARLPAPFERRRAALELTYYVVRIVYVTVLIFVTLLMLGGIIG